jgi:hypothetical protein
LAPKLIVERQMRTQLEQPATKILARRCGHCSSTASNDKAINTPIVIVVS